MEKVAGIGGVFFRAKDSEALGKWYRETLGVGAPAGGSVSDPWEQEAGPTAFQPFPSDTDYFGRETQMFMLNFRVRDLNALVAQLQSAGVGVTVDPENYPYGRFARLKDPEGNPIELWQPAPPGSA